MRACTLFGFLILAAASLAIVTPEITRGQPGGGRQFGGKGGGGPGMMMSMDSGDLFDFLAKGRAFFLITETRSLNAPLMQYAQEKGISNGQITRQQFIDFHGAYKAKMAAGGTPGGNPFAGGANPFGGGNAFGGGKGGPGGKKFGGPDGPGAMTPGGAPQSPDVIKMLADNDFRNRDKNFDGKLNEQEMPGSLRKDLARWDKNGDGLIDIDEYRAYYAARLAGDGDTGGKGATSAFIDEEELDRRPVVLRAGKLPANMPAWFKERDLDNDGQVALYEWRKCLQPLDDFKTWDLNDDGFITPEEALKHQETLAKDNPKENSRGSAGGFASRGMAGGGGDTNGANAFGGKMGKKGGNNPWGGGNNPYGGGTGGDMRSKGKGKKNSSTQDQ